MAKYVVLKDFTDLEDKKEDGQFYVYRKGDPFPRKGRAKKARLDELLGTDNKRGEKLIEEVEEEKEEETKKEADE